VLPFGRLWYTEIPHAIGYAKFRIRSYHSVIRVYDDAGNVIGRVEVLIRVRAYGVRHGDLMLQQSQFPFAFYPVVSGQEIAGVIEKVGKGVGELKPGERVGLSALFSSCECCQQCLDGGEFFGSQIVELSATILLKVAALLSVPSILPRPDRKTKSHLNY
jgi:NADPH:quinone reductase-like Zn-dependent oxidoreductase